MFQQPMISEISTQLSNKEVLKRSLYILTVPAHSYEFSDARVKKIGGLILKTSKLEESLPFSEVCARPPEIRAAVLCQEGHC
jgi:hypothetical protein